MNKVYKQIRDSLKEGRFRKPLLEKIYTKLCDLCELNTLILKELRQKDG